MIGGRTNKNVRCIGFHDRGKKTMKHMLALGALRQHVRNDKRLHSTICELTLYDLVIKHVSMFTRGIHRAFFNNYKYI